MLGHADRGDRVVRAVADVPVVLDPDLDPVGQALLGDAFAGVGGLFLGEGDAGDLRPVRTGGVDGHGTPAAADVQEPVALLQAELAADQVELVALGVLQGPPVLPVGAGVDHGGAEHQGVEVVADVVVVADGLLVAASGVQRAGAAAHFLGGRGRRRPGAREVEEASGEGADPGVADRVDGILGVGAAVPEQPGQMAERFVQVALDIDLTGHPGAGQAQFAGLPQEPPQGAAVVDHEDRGARRPRFAAVPGPDTDRQGFREQLFGKSGQPRRGVCHGAHLRGVSPTSTTITKRTDMLVAPPRHPGRRSEVHLRQLSSHTPSSRYRATNRQNACMRHPYGREQATARRRAPVRGRTRIRRRGRPHHGWRTAPSGVVRCAPRGALHRGVRRPWPSRPRAWRRPEPGPAWRPRRTPRAASPWRRARRPRA